MFSTKNKNSSLPSGTTILGEGVLFTGDIDSQSDIRIDGKVKGNIRCQARILVGASGEIEGNLTGVHADIMGHIAGTITMKELLTIKENALIEGDIYCPKLQMEPTARFTGHCFMTNDEQKEQGKPSTS